MRRILDVLALRGTERILSTLKEKGRVRYSDLADLVGFATTTTRALKAMEEARLVNKEVLNEPYRPVVYSLTEKGKKAADLIGELTNL